MHMVHLQRHTVVSNQFRKFARDFPPNHPLERGEGENREGDQKNCVVTGVLLYLFPLGTKRHSEVRSLVQNRDDFFGVITLKFFYGLTTNKTRPIFRVQAP